MDKYIAYEKAIEVIQESREWCESISENGVYQSYISGVLDMMYKFIDQIETEEMNK